ncbi:MAG: hypothetical protein RL417_2625 [Pseudomonadota bacterium]|jgi:predicted lipid carrier protein YhbT
MAKQHKEDLPLQPAVTSEKEALEIIEVASDELDLLARAFNLIAEVCAGEDEGEDESADPLVH